MYFILAWLKHEHKKARLSLGVKIQLSSQNSKKKDLSAFAAQKQQGKSCHTSKTKNRLSSDGNKKILHLINTAGKINNLLIYDVEFKPMFLKVYISNQKGVVDLDICDRFMKSLLFLFQSEGIEDIECEVSSPGLERKLKKDWHFVSAIGQTIKIHTSEPVVSYDKNSEKKREAEILTGRLDKCQENTISMNDGCSDWTIPLNIITKAHVVFKDIKQSKRGVV